MTHAMYQMQGNKYNVTNKCDKCNTFNGTNVIWQMKYDLCNVTYAMWQMQCDKFNVTNTMQHMQCNKCNVIIVMFQIQHKMWQIV